MRITYTKRQFKQYLILGVLFSIAQNLAWKVSSSWEVLPNIVSWYIPAGINIAFYLFTPVKSWPILFIMFKSASILLFSYGFLSSPDYQLEGMANFVYQLIRIPLTVLAIWGICWQFKRHFQRPYLHHVRSAATLFALCIVVSVFSALAVIIRKFMQGTADWHFVMNIIPSFIAGDLVGIALVLPLAIVLREVVRHSIAPYKSMLFELIGCWFIAITLGYFLNLQSIEFDYLLKTICLLLLLFFSYRHAWMGAALSVFFISLFTFMISLNSNIPVLEQQFYLIIVFLVGSLVGASRHEQLQQKTVLEQANVQLLQTQDKLKETLATMNELSAYKRQTFRLQTNKAFSDFRQEMTTELNNIKARMKIISSPRSQIISTMTDLIALQFNDRTAQYDAKKTETSESLTNLIETELRMALEQSQIELCLHISSLKALSGELNQSLYRIIQEATGNVLRHSKATEVSITLRQLSDHMRLDVSDNGQGFTLGTKTGGFGLQTMQERAASFGGKFKLNTSEKGTTVSVIFPISDSDKSNE